MAKKKAKAGKRRSRQVRRKREATGISSSLVGLVMQGKEANKSHESSIRRNAADIGILNERYKILLDRDSGNVQVLKHFSNAIRDNSETITSATERIDVLDERISGAIGAINSEELAVRAGHEKYQDEDAGRVGESRMCYVAGYKRGFEEAREQFAQRFSHLIMGSPRE